MRIRSILLVLQQNMIRPITILAIFLGFVMFLEIYYCFHPVKLIQTRYLWESVYQDKLEKDPASVEDYLFHFRVMASLGACVAGFMLLFALIMLSSTWFE